MKNLILLPLLLIITLTVFGYMHRETKVIPVKKTKVYTPKHNC